MFPFLSHMGICSCVLQVLNKDVDVANLEFTEENRGAGLTDAQCRGFHARVTSEPTEPVTVKIVPNESIEKLVDISRSILEVIWVHCRSF